MAAAECPNAPAWARHGESCARSVLFTWPWSSSSTSSSQVVEQSHPSKTDHDRLVERGRGRLVELLLAVASTHPLAVRAEFQLDGAVSELAGSVETADVLGAELELAFEARREGTVSNHRQSRWLEEAPLKGGDTLFLTLTGILHALR